MPADYPPDLYWKGEPPKEEYNYVLVDVEPGLLRVEKSLNGRLFAGFRYIQIRIRQRHIRTGDRRDHKVLSGRSPRIDWKEFVVTSA